MRPRQAVLLTPSISLRPVFSRPCKLIAPESTQIPLFVSKRLRTLPSSVSRKSCVCHSYENCRVCTNNSHSGTMRCAPANLPLNQLAWWCLPRPGWGVKSFFLASTLNLRLLNFRLLRPIAFLFTFLRTLLHSPKTQLFSFQSIPHSLPKTTGVGGAWTPLTFQHSGIGTPENTSRIYSLLPYLPTSPLRGHSS